MMRNDVVLRGTGSSEIQFSYESEGEKFFEFIIETKRFGGKKEYDQLVVKFSEKLFDSNKEIQGKNLEVTGEIRTYHEENSKKVEVFVFAKRLQILEENCDANKVKIQGKVCNTPFNYEFPSGLEKVDFLLKVKGKLGKYFYIPCVAWDMNARLLKGLKKNDKLSIEGKFQNREYWAKTSTGERVLKTVYEVNIRKIY